MSQQGNQQHLVATDATAGSARPTRFWQSMAFKAVLRLAIAIIACAALGAWSTYDYDLRCTKCLTSKQIVVQRFFGIPFFRTTRDRPLNADYERIVGHPCQHYFQKGGFGRANTLLFQQAIVACGLTAEGSFIRPRTEAASAAFAAERRLRDQELALETLRIIDLLMPPDAQRERQHPIPAQARGTLLSLSHYLYRVETIEQWRAVLTAARSDFADTTNLPTELLPR